MGKPQGAAKSAKGAKPKLGRPSNYTEELAEAICVRIGNGESVRTICADETMPSQSMIYRWLNQNEDFRERYMRAREQQADTLAEEILKIADDGMNDTYIDSDGNKRTDNDVVARSRLRVDARKWLAAKMAPKKYGDKVEVSGTGTGGAIRIERIELVAL